MKYLYQFLLILTISFVGELLHIFLPLPVPAGIYGMILLFSALMTGMIKPEHVRETGKFLIEIMPVMFIPAGVGLIKSWDILQPILGKTVLITVITLVAVMAATGLVSQRMIRKNRKAGNEQ